MNLIFMNSQELAIFSSDQSMAILFNNFWRFFIHHVILKNEKCVQSFDKVLNESIKNIEDPEEKEIKRNEFITKLLISLIRGFMYAVENRRDECKQQLLEVLKMFIVDINEDEVEKDNKTLIQNNLIRLLEIIL